MQAGSMTFGEGILGAAISAAVGWLAASFTKVSRADFKEVCKRIDTLEKELNGRMTRTEFDGAFSEVKAMVREFRLEARAEFKDLKSELKTKT